MKIQNITTAIKIGEFVLNTGPSKARLRVQYENLPKQVLTDSAGRVYVLCVDDEVMKIGGSVSKKGIKNTMSLYASANTGRPSIRSFGVNQLIAERLSEGKQVSIHMITSEKVVAPVNGLFASENLKISAFKEMEDKCVSDFFAIEGKFPQWNYQEAGKSWEKYIQEEHALILTKTAKKG